MQSSSITTKFQADRKKIASKMSFLKATPRTFCLELAGKNCFPYPLLAVKEAEECTSLPGCSASLNKIEVLLLRKGGDVFLLGKWQYLPSLSVFFSFVFREQRNIQMLEWSKKP